MAMRLPIQRITGTAIEFPMAANRASSLVLAPRTDVVIVGESLGAFSLDRRHLPDDFAIADYIAAGLY